MLNSQKQLTQPEFIKALTSFNEELGALPAAGDGRPDYQARGKLSAHYHALVAPYLHEKGEIVGVLQGWSSKRDPSNFTTRAKFLAETGYTTEQAEALSHLWAIDLGQEESEAFAETLSRLVEANQYKRVYLPEGLEQYYPPVEQKEEITQTV